jgi:hypothetical protein
MNKLHQIYITNDKKSKLPEYTQKCIEILKKKYPDFEYHLYDNDMIISFIESNFDKDVIKSYHKLKPYAYKADLARYCILYTYGGLYVDLNILFSRRVRWIEQTNFFAFHDIGVSSSDYSRIYNGIIWAKPGCAVLKTSINLVIKNCKNEFYGKSPSHPTGPVVLGNSVSSHLKDVKQDLVGSFKLLTDKDPKNPRYGFVVENTCLMAAWKYKDGIDLLDTKTIGFNSWDNYRERWLNKDVYEKSIVV